jgi:hypothetical protein
MLYTPVVAQSPRTRRMWINQQQKGKSKVASLHLLALRGRLFHFPAGIRRSQAKQKGRQISEKKQKKQIPSLSSV